MFPVAWDTSWIFLALVLAVCWQYLHVNPIVAKDDRAAPFMTAAGARELWDGIQVREGMAQDAAGATRSFQKKAFDPVHATGSECPGSAVLNPFKNCFVAS